uniref:Ig-like domain-containing protein n=1 Tax=Periophthalmus magnuspinnatus TaxID=409849 RepID=A0A3B3ZHL5_9GOBI
ILRHYVVSAHCLFNYIYAAGCTDMSLFETRAHDPGETLTLTCPRSVKTTDISTFHWIRVVSGSYPEFLGATFSFDYEPVNKTPHTTRTTTEQGNGTFDLIIRQSSLTDTGFYYCVKVEQLKMELVFGIFLKINGKIKHILRVESPDLSGPVDSGDSVDLQCWVQMENAQCFEEHMVWWFRSGLDQSGPGLVYTQRNSSAQCDRSTEDPGPHKCLYTFSKTMSPSDAGTYRCAVAACGHILFGNGTKTLKYPSLISVDDVSISEHTGQQVRQKVYTYKQFFCCDRFRSNTNCLALQREDELTYSAPKFNMKKAEKSHCRKVKSEDFVVYSDVRK